MIFFLTLTAYIITDLLSITNSKYSCLNPQGKEVDWYIVLLFPRKSSKANEIFYSYYDNLSTDFKYLRYDKSTFPPLQIVKEAISLTNNDKANYFFWNDDLSHGNHKESAPTSKAHSKGGLLYSAEQGIWLLHSLPRFPKRNDDDVIELDLPDNAGIYGQHFTCVTINKENSLEIIKNLNIINVQLISKRADFDMVDKDNKDVEKLIKGKADRKLPNSNRLFISSLKGAKFNLFAKSGRLSEMPYDTMIAPFYSDGLYVETWTKPEMIQNLCKGPYNILNVQNVKFGDYAFNKDQEHSKWAVGMTKNVVCYGDLNRVSSQTKRGGLIMCFENQILTSIMRNSIQNKPMCHINKGLRLLELELEEESF